MANLVEVIVGTYEEFILGYKVENVREENKLQLTQSFATRSHTGSIRCVAVNKHYVASGGADDRIFIYDMISRKEMQILHHHEGTVNTLAFTPDSSHLLTGSDDGKMCAVRLGTWQVEGSWKKAHSGSAVTHISCHPSGKLALTLGSDQTLRTWNLIKGRLAYTTNLKTRAELGRYPECLAWSPDGDHFTLSGQRVLEIWSVKTAGMVKEYKCDSKPISVCWLDTQQIAVGFEDGKLWIFDFKSNNEPKVNEAHKQRVKAISYVNDILATACSSGEVCLWTVKKRSISKIASINIGCRPTCIALLDLTQFGDDYILKQEQEESDEEDVEEEEEEASKVTIKSTGSVVVEVEEEDDEDQSENEEQPPRSKKSKHGQAEEDSKVKKHKKKKKKNKEASMSAEDAETADNSDKKKRKSSEEDKTEESVTPKKQKKKKSKFKNLD